MVEERLVGNVTAAAIMLTHNNTDTEWFHEAAANCDAICFTRGRIKFCRGNGLAAASPPQGQAFFYFGNDVTKFTAVFRDVGSVVLPAIRCP
jgi:hypothetical protein